MQSISNQVQIHSAFVNFKPFVLSPLPPPILTSLPPTSYSSPCTSPPPLFPSHIYVLLLFFLLLPSCAATAVPGAAPLNVSLLLDEDQAAITVSWAPLPSQYYNSDDLEGYSIHYEANNVRINSSGDVMVGPSTTTRILTGLHERVAYTISVAAVNAKGTGPYSSEQTVTTYGQGTCKSANTYLLYREGFILCSVWSCT